VKLHWLTEEDLFPAISVDEGALVLEKRRIDEVQTQDMPPTS